jgi:hypothetical protein
LISIWVAIVLFISIAPVVRLATGYRGQLQDGPPAVTIGLIIGMGILVYLVVGFVRRQPIAVWLALFVLAFWAVSSLFRIPALAADAAGYGASIAMGVVLICLNTLAVVLTVRTLLRDRSK